MRTLTNYTIGCLLLALVLSFGGFRFASTRSYHREIPYSGEHALKVTLSAGFGDLSVSRGKPDALLVADINTEKDADIGNVIDYVHHGDIGYLTVNTSSDGSSKKHSIEFTGFNSNNLDLKFTEMIPISFEFGLGLGKGDLDLTGLNVKDLKISAGASSVRLAFDKPNKGTIEDLTIESGLSKFEGENLCNANFNRLKFEGGVGSYSLDFGGTLNKEVDANIEVGFGSLVVTVPANIGVKVLPEKNWMSHIDMDRDLSEQESDTYYSPNYRSAQGKINMHIEVGLGSVKIRHSN
ncbi:MAG TPA: LiaF domain-containing protein [Bacteroidota bacterium]|nr:LiaF domain-containing protein [Bacteroidota bacterium]